MVTAFLQDFSDQVVWTDFGIGRVIENDADFVDYLVNECAASGELLDQLQTVIQ